MRRYLSVILLLLLSIPLWSCGLKDKQTELVCTPLTESESFIEALSKKKMMLYDLKNLPKGISYKISLVLMEYSDGELIKESLITELIHDIPSEKQKDRSFGISLENKKINFADKGEYATTFTSWVGDFNASDYSYSYLRDGNVTLPLGSSVFLYYGVKGESLPVIDLGVLVTDEVIDNLLNKNNSPVLIKLIIEEIKKL